MVINTKKIEHLSLDYPENIKKQLEKYKGQMTLNIVNDGETWKITGNTFEFKENIKSMGGKWSPLEKAWRLPITTAVDSLYEAVKIKQEERVKAYDTWLYANRFRSQRAGPCCTKAVCQLNPDDVQGPMIYKCPTHGISSTGYTGD